MNFSVRAWVRGVVVSVVITGSSVLVAACGSSSTEPAGLSTSSSSSTTTTVMEVVPVPLTTPAADRYGRYLELTAQLGGKVIGREDAATRAALNCSGAAKSMYGGVPLSQFPTDLALVRAYCPDKESGL